MWTKADYLRTLEATSKKFSQPIAKGHIKHCLGCIKLTGYRQERLRWQFSYPGDLSEFSDSWKVQIINGLEIWQPENRHINAINRQVSGQVFVSYVLSKPVMEVRSRLRLPMHFQIYPISDSTSLHDNTAPYSIAFGQSALLLDTLAKQLKTERKEIWIV